jgi:hypothetical protein
LIVEVMREAKRVTMRASWAACLVEEVVEAVEVVEMVVGLEMPPQVAFMAIA